jgi:hypothetical protein
LAPLKRPCQGRRAASIRPLPGSPLARDPKSLLHLVGIGGVTVGAGPLPELGIEVEGLAPDQMPTGCSFWDS